MVEFLRDRAVDSALPIVRAGGPCQLRDGIGELMVNLPGPKSAEHIRIFRPTSEARLRLVCCPYAGASASAYAALARALPTDIEALAVEYPGRRGDGDRDGWTGIEELADLVSAALAPWADRPLAVLGHSMGP